MDTNQSNSTQSGETAWKIWKTIKLGTGFRDIKGFRSAIKDDGMRIGDWANDLLGNPAFTVAQESTEVNLVILNVTELGFKDGAKLRDIYQAAKQGGLGLCPHEVGPQLRLQYPDQPMGEWLFVGMEPISDSFGCLKVFRVGHDDRGLLLYSFYDYPGNRWGADRRFVFVLPSK